MKDNPMYISGFHKTESTSLWKWKGIDFQTKKPENKLHPVREFFHEPGRIADDVVLGPGVGAGVGCGVGLGLGLGVVGAAGLGGAAWNQLTAVFGIGIGCGGGVGVGYGLGFGGGVSLESLRSHLFDPKPKSKKRVRVQI